MTRGRLVGALVMVAALAVGVSQFRRATLKGQIVLPDGEVRDIAVRVIPEKDVKPYLDGKAAAARVALDERTAAVELARRDVDGAVRAQQLSPGAAAASTPAGVVMPGNADRVSRGPAFSYDPKKYTKAEALTLARARDDEAARKHSAKAAGQFDADNQRLVDAIAAARTRYEEAHARLLAWETDTLADLPKKGSVVHTNGTGHFRATVPRGDRVAVFASGKVTIDGLSRSRAWGLWVNADAVEKPLTLDVKNLLLEQPRDSVLK
jgi:hypothetical protein